MSSDNFYLLRRAGDRYCVSMEFASAQESAEDSPAARINFPRTIDDPRLIWFDDHAAALSYAFGEYSEYGVQDESDTDSSHDTAAHRLVTAAAELASRFELRVCSNESDGSVVLDIGSFQVRVSGPATADRDELFELVSWIEATTPEALASLLAQPAPV